MLIDNLKSLNPMVKKGVFSDEHMYSNVKSWLKQTNKQNNVWIVNSKKSHGSVFTSVSQLANKKRKQKKTLLPSRSGVKRHTTMISYHGAWFD